MAVNVWALKIGDVIREIGEDFTLTVWHIEPPMSGGRAEHWGPNIFAHIRPGGYGTTLDSSNSQKYEMVE